VSDRQDRHLSLETLEKYIKSAAHASVRVPGDPEVLLAIDVPNETLRLEVPWDGEDPPVIGEYLHITTSVFFRNRQNWAGIAVHGLRFFSDAYPLLRSVADHIQLDGASFRSAVKESLASYHELLASSEQMPVEKEVGLFGELLFLEHLVKATGPSSALQAWRGGDEVEEHDFGLDDGDVEVKTTTRDKRMHWISSLNQLVPTAERPLYLLSIQLTAAGASSARRLPDLVSDIGQQLPQDLRSTFLRRIFDAGFKAEQSPETYLLLRLRSAPAYFEVDEDFPRLDYAYLRKAGAAIERIPEVRYLINLDGLTSSKPSATLAGFEQESK
jgi:hypothetical protein